MVRPLLLVFEDLHWATPVVMRYLAELAVAASQCPLILMMTSRI